MRIKRVSTIALLRLRFLALATLVLAPAAGAAGQELQALCPAINQDCTGKIRIGALHIKTPTGARHWQGIKEGVTNHPFAENVCLIHCPYADANTGLEILKGLMGEVDVVVGPTESDVFVRAASLEQEAEEAKVPVISGLVTAEVGNDPGGWFFRTNADVTRRVHAINNFLNKYLINKIAVIYADTEFGRRAARAFEKELAHSQHRREGYTALLYENPPNPRPQVHQILRDRPEAVGLFVEREVAEQIYTELRVMNSSGIPYQPVLFTILDVRPIARQVDDIYFVSVVEADTNFTIGDQTLEAVQDEALPAEDLEPLGELRGQVFVLKEKLVEEVRLVLGEAATPATTRLLREHLETVGESVDGEAPTDDEVEALGYDTALLVMERLEALDLDPGSEEWRLELRKQLVTLMQGSEILAGRTGLRFSNFQNTAILHVSHLRDRQIVPIDVTKVVSWPGMLRHKVELLVDIYSWWLLLSFLIIALAAFLISRMDLRRSFPKKHVRIFHTWVFYLHAFSHFAIVAALYVFLAETGRIRYNDLLMVVLISVTPSAFLRTTLFETRKGKSIGLEGVYKSWMRKLEERIMRSRYQELEALTNTVAYNNAEDTMRRALTRVYRNHPSATQQAHLIQRMEEAMANEPRYLDRRRVGADLLLKQFGEDELKAEGLLPPDWDSQQPFDPRHVIRRAARNCSEKPQLIKRVDKLLSTELEKLNARNPKRHDELEAFMEKELKLVLVVEGELNVKLRILLVLVGFRLSWFKRHKFLSAEDVEKERRGPPAKTGWERLLPGPGWPRRRPLGEGGSETAPAPEAPEAPEEKAG